MCPVFIVRRLSAIQSRMEGMIHWRNEGGLMLRANNEIKTSNKFVFIIIIRIINSFCRVTGTPVKRNGSCTNLITDLEQEQR